MASDVDTTQGSLVIRRLQTLVAAGYVPDLSWPELDHIDLKHPDGKHAVMLGPSGIVGDRHATNSAPYVIFEAEQEDDLRAYLARTPKLTLMQRLRGTTIGDFADNITAVFWAVIVLGGLGWLIDVGLKAVWHVIRG